MHRLMNGGGVCDMFICCLANAQGLISCADLPRSMVEWTTRDGRQTFRTHANQLVLERSAEHRLINDEVHIVRGIMMELKQMAPCILEIASKHYCHMVEGPLDPLKHACNVNNDLGKRPETLKTLKRA